MQGTLLWFAAALLAHPVKPDDSSFLPQNEYRSPGLGAGLLGGPPRQDQDGGVSASYGPPPSASPSAGYGAPGPGRRGARPDYSYSTPASPSARPPPGSRSSSGRGGYTPDKRPSPTYSAPTTALRPADRPSSSAYGPPTVRPSSTFGLSGGARFDSSRGAGHALPGTAQSSSRRSSATHRTKSVGGTPGGSASSDFNRGSSSIGSRPPPGRAKPVYSAPRSETTGSTLPTTYSAPERNRPSSTYGDPDPETEQSDEHVAPDYGVPDSDRSPEGPPSSLYGAPDEKSGTTSPSSTYGTPEESQEPQRGRSYSTYPPPRAGSSRSYGAPAAGARPPDSARRPAAPSRGAGSPSPAYGAPSQRPSPVYNGPAPTTPRTNVDYDSSRTPADSYSPLSDDETEGESGPLSPQYGAPDHGGVGVAMRPSSTYIPPDGVPDDEDEEPDDEGEIRPASPAPSYIPPEDDKPDYEGAVGPTTPAPSYVPPKSVSISSRGQETSYNSYLPPTSNPGAARQPRPSYLPPGGEVKPSASYSDQEDDSPDTTYGAPREAEISSTYLPPNVPGGSRGHQSTEQQQGSEAGSAGNSVAKYVFNYDVNDRLSGTAFGQQESREGDVTHGQYNVLLPDGRKQTVQYEADSDGFRPKIRYEGQKRTKGRKRTKGKGRAKGRGGGKGSENAGREAGLGAAASRGSGYSPSSSDSGYPLPDSEAPYPASSSPATGGGYPSRADGGEEHAPGTVGGPQRGYPPANADQHEGYPSSGPSEGSSEAGYPSGAPNSDEENSEEPQGYPSERDRSDDGSREGYPSGKQPGNPSGRRNGSNGQEGYPSGGPQGYRSDRPAGGSEGKGHQSKAPQVFPSDRRSDGPAGYSSGGPVGGNPRGISLTAPARNYGRGRQPENRSDDPSSQNSPGYPAYDSGRQAGGYGTSNNNSPQHTGRGSSGDRVDQTGRGPRPYPSRGPVPPEGQQSRQGGYPPRGSATGLRGVYSTPRPTDSSEISGTNYPSTTEAWGSVVRRISNNLDTLPSADWSDLTEAEGYSPLITGYPTVVADTTSSLSLGQGVHFGYD